MKIKTNLNGALQSTQITNGILMTGDDAANQIIVELHRDHTPVLISQGTQIEGVFLRSDGESYVGNGEVTEEGYAKVTVPAFAYEISGNLSIAIRMYSDGSKIVIGSVTIYVQNTETDLKVGEN